MCENTGHPLIGKRQTGECTKCCTTEKCNTEKCHSSDNIVAPTGEHMLPPTMYTLFLFFFTTKCWFSFVNCVGQQDKFASSFGRLASLHKLDGYTTGHSRAIKKLFFYFIVLKIIRILAL